MTFVELFFDLVFVFALTEVTSFAVNHLDAGGLTRALLIFWLVWWAWTQWTWALNPADTEHGLVRLGTLTGTAVAFLMAVSLGRAFEEQGGLWFVVPYVIVRVGGLSLYAWVTSEDSEQFAAVRGFALFSVAGLASAVLGGFADPEARVWWWLGTVVLDLVAAGRSGRFGWNLHPDHFAERHGLIVIIALGESLIVSAVAVAGAEWRIELAGVAIGAVLVTCLLWWTYFGWFNEALTERFGALSGAAQSTFGRDAYSLLHFPLVAGVVGIAVGFKAMVAHPEDVLDASVLMAFAGGVGTFLLSAAAIWARAWSRVLWWRLVVPAVLYLVLLLAEDIPPSTVLALTAVAVAAIIAAEALRPPAPGST